LNAADGRSVHEVSAHMRPPIREIATREYAIDAVRVALMAPDPDADLLGLVELTQSLATVEPGDAYLRYLLGLAHYRAGQFEQADAELQQVLTISPEWEPRRMAFPIRAMTYHRLGRAADARSALNEAARAI